MKTPKILYLLSLLLLQVSLRGQMQWYQNQDGNNAIPYGTYASAINEYSGSTFIACYQWQVENNITTWKISKTSTSGTELRTFFVSGITASAEVRVKKNSYIYVLKRSYPFGQDPEYTVYRLNANLDIVAQRTLTFPGSYSIINLNAFEIDDNGNVYLAGDGQYPDGYGYGFSSFVLKTTKNLITRWLRMDSVQTSYARLHIDPYERVTVIEDFYTFYPAVNVIQINKNGTQAVKKTIVPDSSRYTLYSVLDRNNNLYLYGGKMPNDTTQGTYICKVSGTTGNVQYRKTLFTGPVSVLNDLKMDRNGKMFSLSTQYYPGEIQTRISRINPNDGHLMWNHTISFSNDRCLFNRLVVNESDRFFAVGEERSGDYFAKGFALRMKKSGQADGNLPAPDSVAWQRYHTLLDGIIDNNNRLISIGNTNDLDTATYSSTYYRAFAVRLEEGGGGGCNRNAPVGETVIEEEETAAAETAPEEVPATVTTPATEESKETNVHFQLFPNPVQDQLSVRNIDMTAYDKITIYDMKGQIMLQQKVTMATARFDVSTLAEGVYVIALRSAKSMKEKTTKFVISR
ncbi:MAG: T9SS type A sorting domain-containing protein [Chitinophagaceae bacterium]